MAAAVSRAFAAFALVYTFMACSSDGDEKSNVGTGGGFGTGGLPGTGGAPVTGGVPAAGGVSATGGLPVTGGTPGAGGGPAAGGGFATGGFVGTGGITPLPTGGVPGNGGAASGGAASGGSSGSTGGAAGNDLNALRASCLATINNYRASLNSGLKPLVRPNASIETCSDQGAASDAASGIAHQSAGKCRPAGSQNTCPGFPPDRTTGVEGAMKQCLSQMWAEGEPTEGRQECLRKYFAGDQACFLAHGHYLNMSDAGNGFVSCGFFTMTNGRIWMNQDFGPGAP